VRASVEAAIAARKAALRARHCTTCEAVVEDGDAFCRSCGTKVTA
jgi:RNA polymerase subunit RPABC4/transcription elongation factor Spt4